MADLTAGEANSACVSVIYSGLDDTARGGRSERKRQHLRSGESSPVESAVHVSHDLVLKPREPRAQHQAMRRHTALLPRLEERHVENNRHPAYYDAHVQKLCLLPQSVQLRQLDVCDIFKVLLSDKCHSAEVDVALCATQAD